MRRADDGRGVDVVLNSLAGDGSRPASRCLAEHGRFLEIGKRDIWSAERFAAVRPDGALLRDRSGRAAAKDPARSARAVPRRDGRSGRADCSARFRCVPFPLRSAAAAFRFMAQARHIGKIVLIPEEAPVARSMASDGAGELPRDRRPHGHRPLDGRASRWSVARGTSCSSGGGRPPRRPAGDRSAAANAASRYVCFCRCRGTLPTVACARRDGRHHAASSRDRAFRRRARRWRAVAAVVATLLRPLRAKVDGFVGACMC